MRLCLVGPCAPWILCSSPSRADKLRALRALLVLSPLRNVERLLHLGGHGGGHTGGPKASLRPAVGIARESLWEGSASGLALGLPFKGLRRTAEGPRWTLWGGRFALPREALASMPDLSAEDLWPRAGAPPTILLAPKMKDAYHFEDSQLSRIEPGDPELKRVSATGSREGGRRCDVSWNVHRPRSLNLTVPAGGKVTRWSFTEGR